MSKEEQFETFWRAYPRRVAKGAARKAFDKAIKKTTLQAMLEAVQKYERHKPEKIDFKHPATWLNGECWDDEWEVKAPTFTFAGPRPSEAYGYTPPKPISPEEQARRAAMVQRLREEGVLGRTMQ